MEAQTFWATAGRGEAEREEARHFVLFIPDGAADRDRRHGKTPLGEAHIPYCDHLAREGVTGRLHTLYADLPRESMVAQLGMLGWDPRRFYPHGRASSELLALDGVSLEEGDLAFRANLVRFAGRRLLSYSADAIRSEVAAPLVALVDRELRRDFPAFELRHNSDFRNTLVVRGANVDARLLHCREPHECEGRELGVEELVVGRDAASARLAAEIWRYLRRAADLLAGEPGNALFPWSASLPFRLPAFSEVTGFAGSVVMVGFMDFLKGIARAGSLGFVRLGNGRPDTDYRAKGAAVTELLDGGCRFVICHVNGPDEAAHLGSRELKIASLEAFDRHTVGPTVEWFGRHPGQLGGVMVVPDHYTNLAHGNERRDAHSLDPIPFALWNGRQCDGVAHFDEDAVLAGRFGRLPLGHLQLLPLLGVARRGGLLADRLQAGAGMSVNLTG